MNNSSHLIDLETGAVLRLRHAVGSSISVASGCAWITQEGDTRDIVLSRGMQFVLDRPSLAIVRMLEAGKLHVDFVDSPRLDRACLIKTLKTCRQGASRL